MKKKILRTIVIIVSTICLLMIIVPLFISPEGASGLKEPLELITEGADIVTISFEGTDGLDIYYEYEKSDTSSKNYILLHGSMYNSKTWSEVTDYFATMGNVYAYDQLPYGYSEKLVEGDWKGENPYTTESAIEQLKLFMDELGIERATLVGSSFGGVLAAEAALRYEEQVEALILVDPAIFVSESMPEWLLELPQVKSVGPLFAAGLSEGDSFYESTFYDKELITNERMAYNKRETHINNWNLAMWAYLKVWSLEPSSIGDRLSEISQPVLVITGDHDEIVPVEDSIKVADMIQGAELVIIEDCGHMPHEEKPIEFIRAIDNWLE